MRRAPLFLATVLAALVVLPSEPAYAHGFSSVVYADVSSPRANHVNVKLALEFDLLLVSVASSEKDDRFFREGQPAWDVGDYPGMVKAARGHASSIAKYLAQRFTMATGTGAVCKPSMNRVIAVAQNESQDVSYATVLLDYACPPTGVTEHGHVIRSTVFPDSEGYVKQTKTLLTYELDGQSGSATVDDVNPSFSTEQAWYQRFAEFFGLGAQHLLTGIDHILFLLALIAGSRRLREVVLGATAFTLAHTVTFILAAVGVVSPPGRVVEPVIALSIAAVGGWHLWRMWRYGPRAGDLLVISRSHLSLDASGWVRLGVVFAFGLIHGLGFAAALGITSSFSWQLLWSLVVFNIGIEAVQVGIIVATFPMLALLRRRDGRLHLLATGVISAGVTVMGLIWLVQRVTSG